MRDDEINAPQPSTSAMSNEQSSKISETAQKIGGDKKTAHPSTSKPAGYGNHEFGYNTPIPFAPWRRKRYSLSIDGLHDEIIDLYHWIRPNELEARIRRHVFEKVHQAVMKRWKDRNVKVSMFGSLRTTLFLPTSDIDVLVECPAPKTESGASYDWLNETAKILQEDQLADSINVYSEAFVPIVKMVDRDTKLSIDISFNTVQGVRAADYIEKVKNEFPIIEPLVLLLKQFLHYRNLNQTFTGGLSSYGLILMLVNFLQSNALSLRKKNIYDKGVNLGEILLRFFEVYSQEFNFEDIGISVAQMRYIPKAMGVNKNGTKRSQSGNIMLEDPLFTSNDVGRSTYNFSSIAMAFGQALQILMVCVTVRDRKRSPIWQTVYRGSMLHMIMPFTSKDLKYRNWLMGSGISYPQAHASYDLNIVNSTLLSPAVDMTTFDWLRRAPISGEKVSRPLKIEAPTDVTEKKSVEVKAKVEVVASCKKEPVEELKSDDTQKDDEITAPPMPTSTASVTTSVSTAASISEREDTDSPPLSSVIASSDEDLPAQTSTSVFKKPFSVVVATKPKEVSRKTQTQNLNENCNSVDNRFQSHNQHNHQHNVPLSSYDNRSYRHQNSNRNKKNHSRNHSRESDGSRGSDFTNRQQRYSRNDNSKHRRRASSNSSNNSQNSSASSLRHARYHHQDSFYPAPSSAAIENGNSIGTSTESMMNPQTTSTATISTIIVNGRFRYADVVANGNTPNRVKPPSVEATVAITNGNTTPPHNADSPPSDTPTKTPEKPVIKSYRQAVSSTPSAKVYSPPTPLASNESSQPTSPLVRTGDSKTLLNSPTINEISQQVLLPVNRISR